MESDQIPDVVSEVAHAEGAEAAAAARRAVAGGDGGPEPGDAQPPAAAVATAELLEQPLSDQTSCQGYVHAGAIGRKRKRKRNCVLMDVLFPLGPDAGQKDVPQSTSPSSTTAQVTSGGSSSGDVQIPTGSAEVAADIAKYTNKVIWPILLSINSTTSVFPF